MASLLLISLIIFLLQLDLNWMKKYQSSISQSPLIWGVQPVNLSLLVLQVQVRWWVSSNLLKQKVAHWQKFQTLFLKECVILFIQLYQTFLTVASLPVNFHRVSKLPGLFLYLNQVVQSLLIITDQYLLCLSYQNYLKNLCIKEWPAFLTVMMFCIATSLDLD